MVIVRICPTCGLQFIVYPSAKKTFCSNKCAAQHNNKFKPQNQPNRIAGICPICGKGFSASPSHKRKFCSHSCASKVANLGKIPWNRGIPWPPKITQKISEANRGKQRTLEFRQNQSKRLRGEQNPSKRPKVRQKISLKLSKEWNEHTCLFCGNVFKRPPYQLERARFCSRQCLGRYRIYRINNDEKLSKRRLAALQKKPTKPEARIINILNKFGISEYKYVGDGAVKLAGLYPDFINVNGAKKIIEVFGRVYHDPTKSYGRMLRPSSQEPYRKAIYASLGFDCLVLWDDEMEKLSDEEIADIIRDFTKSKHKPTAQLSLKVG